MMDWDPADASEGSYLACLRGGLKPAWLDLGPDREGARDRLGAFWADPESARRYPRAQIYRRGAGERLSLSSEAENWVSAESEEFRERAAKAQAERIGEAAGLGGGKAPRGRRL